MTATTMTTTATALHFFHLCKDRRTNAISNKFDFFVYSNSQNPHNYLIFFCCHIKQIIVETFPLQRFQRRISVQSSTTEISEKLTSIPQYIQHLEKIKKSIISSFDSLNICRKFYKILPINVRTGSCAFRFIFQQRIEEYMKTEIFVRRAD